MTGDDRQPLRVTHPETGSQHTFRVPGKDMDIVSRLWQRLGFGTQAVADHDQAVRDLWANQKREERAGVRHETPEFTTLNAQVNQAREGLTPLQRSHPATAMRIARAQRREGQGRSR